MDALSWRSAASSCSRSWAHPRPRSRGWRACDAARARTRASCAPCAMPTPSWVTSSLWRSCIRGGARGRSCARCSRRWRNAPPTWPCACACWGGWPTWPETSSTSPSACSRPTKAFWPPIPTTAWWRGLRSICIRRPSAGAAWWRPTRSCSVPSQRRRCRWARAWPSSNGPASSARPSWRPSPWPSSGVPGPTAWLPPIPTCAPIWNAWAKQPKSGRRCWACWRPGWTAKARRGRARRSRFRSCAGACSLPASGWIVPTISSDSPSAS